MDLSSLIGLLAVGFAAGVLSGLVGVGGGILFVPALVIFLDKPILQATSTSLVAVVAVAAVGAWRQHTHGNVRIRDALIVMALSPVGVVIGGVVSNNVPERAIEIAFAAFQIYLAYKLLRGRKAEPEPTPEPAG
ncbi:MAG: uncharacterized protein QOG62_367 [Thermoleophilaceae bacterium]|jgi:uncharacterized membrane protein YfcA|nr:uncharacterized protein [Thermoleophilaceae bacterium]